MVQKTNFSHFLILKAPLTLLSERLRLSELDFKALTAKYCDFLTSQGRVKEACLAHLASGRKQAAVETLHLAQVSTVCIRCEPRKIFDNFFLGARTCSTTSSTPGQRLRGKWREFGGADKAGHLLEGGSHYGGCKVVSKYLRD